MFKRLSALMAVLVILQGKLLTIIFINNNNNNNYNDQKDPCEYDQMRFASCTRLLVITYFNANCLFLHGFYFPNCTYPKPHDQLSLRAEIKARTEIPLDLWHSVDRIFSQKRRFTRYDISHAILFLACVNE